MRNRAKQKGTRSEELLFFKVIIIFFFVSKAFVRHVFVNRAMLCYVWTSIEKREKEDQSRMTLSCLTLDVSPNT